MLPLRNVLFTVWPSAKAPWYALGTSAFLNHLKNHSSLEYVLKLKLCLLEDNQVNTFDFWIKSPEERAKNKRHHFILHSDLVKAIMKEDVYKSLGPSWQSCVTVNSSLARGLENTLKLLRKASAARNTWGNTRYTTGQVLHFSMIIGSFCFYW